MALTLLATAAAAAGIVLQLSPAHSSSAEARAAPPSAKKQHLLDAFGKIPLAFTANAGQTDARVRYSAPGAGFSVFLTRSEAMFALQRPGEHGKGMALALRFLGANRHVAIRGERPAPGRVNYLLGNDPSKWHTGLRSYERVVYRDLWPGVDMAFAGQGGKLKYEFLVRPGARVRDIRLAYRGAKQLSRGRQGNLRIRTALGVLGDERPISYQLVQGRRVPVASSFALSRSGAGYGFSVDRGYDRRYPLVIDPGLLYSTYLGSELTTTATGSRSTARAAPTSPGYTSSTDFPTTAGAFDTSRQRRRETPS